MTLIEMLVFLFFVGGGAYGGISIAAALGAGVLGVAIGALSGAFFLFVVLPLGFYWQDKHTPVCVCGAQFSDNSHDSTYTCNACNQSYQFIKGDLVSLISPDGTLIPYMRRDFWCYWRPVSTSRSSETRTPELPR
ncbi:MAG: hypothetical protein LBB55_00625 [Zoogloeaceae bacterium]|nr:hypothetical protein [Zoogloeaceae bacterium]